MEYIKPYQNFISSYYLSEGIRKSTGILIPVLLCSFFGLIPVGLVMAIGALCIGVVDNPGSFTHQKNGMMVANAVIFITAIITGLAAHNVFALGIVLFIFSFLYAMAGVYGARVNAIGIAGLLVMILNIFQVHKGIDILLNALYLLAGGAWYMLFTLALYSFRPYKLARQMLGDWVQSVAVYLRARASFYDRHAAVDSIYNQLFQLQVTVQDSQNQVSDLIFKTRSIARESTHIGRIIVVIYLDAVELFEHITTSYQDYKSLHSFFDETEILDKYKDLALKLSAELDEVGLALKMGRPAQADDTLQEQITAAKDYLNHLRQTLLNPENIEGFIYLRNIINNIQDIHNRILRLQQYTTFDEDIKIKKPDIDHEELISHQDYSPKLFFDNLSLQSDIFRHSLRVSIAVIVGFLIGELFTIGHSYWILLTIIIILKPTYSLTKKRNKDRLLGTLAGIVIGVAILYIIHNHIVLLVLLIILMTVSNSFARNRYFLSVMIMTPYILIFFRLLNEKNFTDILADRMIDTLIGSAIAFIASLLLLPSWERSKIKSLMEQMLKDNRHYFLTITHNLFGVGDNASRKMMGARKNAFIALANLSGTFNRILSEPRSQHTGLEEIHHFIVLNHMLASHIASLSHIRAGGKEVDQKSFEMVISDVNQNLSQAIACLENKKCDTSEPNDKKSLQLLNEGANRLMEIRKQELQAGQLETETKKTLLQVKTIVNQFNFIYSISLDILKVSKKVKTEP